jgi:hypothetical protein
MFVYPQQYLDVTDWLQCLDSSRVGLQVVVNENFEYLIDEILSVMPFQQRPKLKSGERGRTKIMADMKNTSTDHMVSAVLSSEERGIIVLKRTVLCLKPKDHVTQSTTDAVDHERGTYYRSMQGKEPPLNPRRKIATLDMS